MKIVIEFWDGDQWVSAETVDGSTGEVFTADGVALTESEIIKWSESKGSTVFQGKRAFFADNPEEWVQGFVARAKTLSRVRARVLDS